MDYNYLYISGVHLISYILLILMLIYVLIQIWWTPKRIENHFLKQGIKGPKYKLLVGNLKELAALNLKASAQTFPHLSHHILPRVLSFYHHWKNIYGPMFLVWFGNTASLMISEPDLIKEVLVSKSDYYEKIEPPLQVKRIEGNGLLNLNGQKWAHHRKIIHPIFYTDNLKLMLPMMAKTVDEALTKWSDKISKYGKVEIDVSIWFPNLMEDVITRATFGSSYEAGRTVFQLQAKHIAHATEAYHKICIPGYRFLPTIKNIISWKMEREIRKSLLNLISDQQRRMTVAKYSGECPNNLLDVMIKAGVAQNDIIEECKTFLFAGKETTSNLLTWTALLLAMHPQWQERAREEVLMVCGARDTPTKDHLAKLKTLGMILNESLRLYPPVVATIRRAKKDVQLGELNIPRGTNLILPILAVHHDSGLWGHDAHEFNPERFATGVGHAAAEHTMAFMPFGSGMRRCVGQNLAVLQTKLVIAMILRHFSFELSPAYVHAPSIIMILHPQHGAPLIYRKL